MDAPGGLEAPTPPTPSPRRFRTRMASGVVALIPLVVTVWVMRFLFTFTAGILLPFVDPAVGNWPAPLRAALSFGILLVFIYALGTLATHVVGRRILGLGEAIVLRVPLVRVVYSASRQVVAAFQGRGSRAFQSVVFVEFPGPGNQAIGFVTGSFTRPDGTECSTVFVPTTPNPTTGFLQIYPKDRLVTTEYTVEEGIKMIMSLGVLVPDPAHRTPPRGRSRERRPEGPPAPSV